MNTDKLLTFIREKDINSIVNSMFDLQAEKVGVSYRNESELWDYKAQLPVTNSSEEWAELAKDVLSFHNTRKGGLLLFGITDKTYEIVGISAQAHFDSKMINDKIRKYIGDQIWVDIYYPIEMGAKTIAIALIPPLLGNIKRFLRNSPEKRGKLIFKKDGSAIRKHDSSCVLTKEEADALHISNSTATYSQYSINTASYRLLAPEYTNFVRRERYCLEIEKGLSRNRVAAVTLTGIGGIGKTSLAIWAANQAYLKKSFSYIVSMTAKDRELTASGIQAMYQHFTTLNDLLDEILEVIGFEDMKELPQNKKEEQVKELITGSNMLLLLDNLETTSDDGIKNFINDLPDGVKAIITSRRNIVNVSSYPIEVEGLEDEEIITLISTIGEQYPYCTALSRTEKIMIGEACNRIPLAIKWIISRNKSISELLNAAETLQMNGKDSSELLEFVFRRTFDKMNQAEQRIMQILSVSPNIPEEAIIQASGNPEGRILDSLSNLVRDTIVVKKYDSDINWYRYSLLPLSRNFIARNCLPPTVDRNIRRKLTAWYQAEDISDGTERQLVQRIRQSGQNIGVILTDVAKSALRRGDHDSARKFFDMALSRDPQNWRVYKEYGDYYRREGDNRTLAIQYYQGALKRVTVNTPDVEEARLRREYAMMYMNSGEQNAMSESIKNLEIAHSKMPSDPITAKFLAICYSNKGHYIKGIDLLQPYLESKDLKTQSNLWPILLDLYEKVPEKYQIKKSELVDKMERRGIKAG